MPRPARVAPARPRLVDLARDLLPHPGSRPDVAYYLDEYVRGEWLPAERLDERRMAALRRLVWCCLLDVPFYAGVASELASAVPRIERPEHLALLPVQRRAARLRAPERFACAASEAALADAIARRAAVRARAERWAGAPPATVVVAWGPDGDRAEPPLAAADRSAFAAALARAGDVVVSAPAIGLASLAETIGPPGTPTSIRSRRRRTVVRSIIARGPDPDGAGPRIARDLAVPLHRWLTSGAGVIAASCDRAGPMHVLADHVLLEAVDARGAPLPPDEAGELLLTDLHDHATPRLRLELGLRGRLLSRRCECGRSLPLIELEAPAARVSDGG